MMQKRKQMDETQPKCRVEVCRKSCPYRDKPFMADIVRLANGSDAVCLLKEMKSCEWSSCIVMYLNGTCKVGDKSIEKDVFSFMRGHVARVMMNCPLRMEHLMSGWSNERRS